MFYDWSWSCIYFDVLEISYFRVNLGFSAVVLQYNKATSFFIITITITILYTFLHKSTHHFLFKFLITRTDFWPKNFCLIYRTQMQKVELSLYKKVNQHCCRAPPNPKSIHLNYKNRKSKKIYVKRIHQAVQPNRHHVEYSNKR